MYKESLKRTQPPVSHAMDNPSNPSESQLYMPGWCPAGCARGCHRSTPRIQALSGTAKIRGVEACARLDGTRPDAREGVVLAVVRGAVQDLRDVDAWQAPQVVRAEHPEVGVHAQRACREEVLRALEFIRV